MYIKYSAKNLVYLKIDKFCTFPPLFAKLNFLKTRFSILFIFISLAIS